MALRNSSNRTTINLYCQYKKKRQILR